MKPSPADTHVVIAGAGIAGLAAAMILAEAGCESHCAKLHPKLGARPRVYVSRTATRPSTVCGFTPILTKPC